MEQQETSVAVTTRSAGMRYGLISGIISIAYFLVLSISGVDTTQGFWQWFGWCVPIILLVLAHKYYKDNGDGFMSYGQGLSIAFWMGLISSVISSIFTYLYVKFIDTGFIDLIKERQIQAMEEKGMSDEQIDQAMQIASMFMTPEAMLIFGLIAGIIGTLIIGLIVTIFTQKKNPEQTF